MSEDTTNVSINLPTNWMVRLGKIAAKKTKTTDSLLRKIIKDYLMHEYAMTTGEDSIKATEEAIKDD